MLSRSAKYATKSFPNLRAAIFVSCEEFVAKNVGHVEHSYPILLIESRARYKKWLDNNPEKKSKYQKFTKSWNKIRRTEEKAMGRLASLAKLNSVSDVLSNSDLSQIKPKIHLKSCSFCGLQFQRGGPQDSPGRKTIHCSVKCKKDATKVRDARSHQNCRDRKLFEKYKRQIVFLGFLLTKKFKICLHPQPEISK